MLRYERTGWCYLLIFVNCFLLARISTVENFLITWADVCPWNNTPSWEPNWISFVRTTSWLLSLLIRCWKIIPDALLLAQLLLHYILLDTLTRRSKDVSTGTCRSVRLLSSCSIAAWTNLLQVTKVLVLSLVLTQNLIIQSRILQRYPSYFLLLVLLNRGSLLFLTLFVLFLIVVDLPMDFLVLL